MSRFKACLVGVLLMLSGMASAWAGKADDTLRITLRDAIPNVDPYYNTQRAGLIMATHVWDTLIDRDPTTSKLVPGLATEWRNVDDLTIEFKLRPDVKFQNGDTFSADDVVYTINTVIADKKVATPSNYAWIAGADKVDGLTVRVRLKKPFPVALEYLASVTPIWPKAYRERVGEEEYSRRPVGTGPYAITKLEGAGEIRMERFEGRFTGGGKPRPAIKTIIFRSVADPTTQMAELIGGKADWIEDVNADQFNNLAGLPNVATLRAEAQRMAYIVMNAAGRDNPESPIRDVRVRQAISYAIDRETMARQFMPGGSRVPDIVCFDTQFGCNSAGTIHYSYDPMKAKALLAEAGHSNGIDVELYSYLAPPWGGAIQNYLRAVGINARLNQVQVSAAIQLFQQGKLPLAIGAWGGFGVNDVSTYLQYFFTATALDQARDPKLQQLVEQGGGTNDADARLKAYNEAFKVIAAQAYFLPLFTYVKNYAFTKDLDFKAYPDDWLRFYRASWK